MTIPAVDQKHLDFVHAHTTTVVTYTTDKTKKSKPIGRGTGVLVQWGGRHYVLTNTHVMEKYFCCKYSGHETLIQIKGLEGTKGVEEHNGYLLMPKKLSNVGGVTSEYGHRDVGIIEVKTKFLKEIGKTFLPESEIRACPLKTSEEVFFKAFPGKSVEFHAHSQKSLFGWWVDFRSVAQVYDNLVITKDAPLRSYKDSSFSEDGQDLHGISGCGVFTTDHKLAGLVWGGVDDTIGSAIWIVPSKVLIEVLKEYELKQYTQQKD